MAGFMLLSNADTEALLSPKLKPINVTSEEFNHEVGEYVLTNPFKYYYDAQKNTIIILSPLPANNFTNLLPYLERYFKKGKINNPHLFMGLIGRGATEQHIVTAYVRKEDTTRIIDIFDPKSSNPKRFFSGSGNAVITALLGIFRSLNPFSSTNITLDGGAEEIVANYHALGTQSFFDGVSCGYHNAANILACKKLIDNDQEITRDSLLAEIGNPVAEAADFLKKNQISSQKVDSDFSSFMKKAWFDTMMPLASDEDRATSTFANYFLGWPKGETRGEIAFYFLSLSFLTTPIANLIRRPIELTLNVISEGANYLKNRLINWAPTNIGAQYLRSIALFLTTGIQLLFKGAYVALRPLTSPITSFRAAQTIENPILRNVMSALSVVMSIGALAAIAYFAAPVLLAGIPGVGPVASVLAWPVVKLLGLFGVSVAPATAAATTVIASAALYNGIKSATEPATHNPVEKTVEQTIESSKKKDLEIPLEIESDDIPESNVVKLFKQQGITSGRDVVSSKHDARQDGSSKRELSEGEPTSEPPKPKDGTEDDFILVDNKLP